MLKLNIIIPYRPSIGAMTSFFGKLVQDSNERWLSNNKYINQRDETLNIPKRAIDAILKNSRFKHNIIVAIDSDMFPHKKWLKEYDNVRIFKGSSVCPDPPYESLLRMTALENEVNINTLKKYPEWLTLCNPIQDAVSKREEKKERTRKNRREAKRTIRRSI